MDILLEFIYNKSHYIIIKQNDFIYLGKIESNQYIKINDNEKQTLKKIIELFINDNLDKEKLDNQKIIVLNKKQRQIPFNSKYLIGLVFSNQQVINIVNNCKTIYKHHTHISSKHIYLTIIISVLIISFVLLIYIRNENHTSLYKQYINIKTENEQEFTNQQLKMVKLKNQEAVDVFDDEFLSFDSFCEGYKLANQETKTNYQMNIYRSNNCPYLAIMKSKSISEEELKEIDAASLNINNNRDIQSIYKRYGINNLMDLIYNVVIYNNKKINKTSSKQEIKDRIFFETARKVVIPYSKESKTNEFIFYEGQSNSYTYINDKMIVIYCLVNGNDYKIIIQNTDELDLNLININNIMNTLKIKQ